jgi:N-acetylneuraminic acid mutarotase
MQWREVQAQGDWPSRRSGHAAAVVGSKIYMFGGKDEQGRLLNDLYILHTSSGTQCRGFRG